MTGDRAHNTRVAPISTHVCMSRSSQQHPSSPEHPRKPRKFPLMNNHPLTNGSSKVKEDQDISLTEGKNPSRQMARWSSLRGSISIFRGHNAISCNAAPYQTFMHGPESRSRHNRANSVVLQAQPTKGPLTVAEKANKPTKSPTS